MDYNTSLSPLRLPEYGRIIHRMIEHCTGIEDREKRNLMARAIIDVMGNLNPHLRDVADFKHKLWDHLFIMSDFKLDVDSPYPIPGRESFQTKPDRVAYPAKNIRYRHYGKSVETLIEKANQMEEGDMKTALVEQIANLMKKLYVSWNKDSVSDEVILAQLSQLSGGKLKVAENVKLNSGEVPQGNRVFHQHPHQNKKKKNKHHAQKKKY